MNPKTFSNIEDEVINFLGKSRNEIIGNRNETLQTNLDKDYMDNNLGDNVFNLETWNDQVKIEDASDIWEDKLILENDGLVIPSSDGNVNDLNGNGFDDVNVFEFDGNVNLKSEGIYSNDEMENECDNLKMDISREEEIFISNRKSLDLKTKLLNRNLLYSNTSEVLPDFSTLKMNSVQYTLPDEEYRTDICSTISDCSDQDDGIIEEMIVMEKIKNLKKENNYEEKENVDVASDLLCESYPQIKINICEKKELQKYAKLLAEAIEYNVSMRNYLWDLEHTLLLLVEKSSTSVATNKKFIKMVSKKSHIVKRKRFYNTFLAPYFKDKRGITYAKYVLEDILPECGSMKEFMNLYTYTFQSQIYDIYSAVVQFFEENKDLIIRNDSKGRKKLLKIANENENDLHSMEMQFVNFLKMYKTNSQMFIDKNIDWHKVSFMHCVQGLTSKDCEHTWNMVLKPLLQVGCWSQQENEKILRIAKRYNYQNWDDIAIELDTGRSGYLCFCHVMNKPISGLTQNVGAWTKEEDDFLMKLVKKCTYGNSIMWGRILYFFEDRAVTQVLNRWYRLNPALKRGKFSHREDIMLMYCIEQFGRDFGKIATLFGNRSPIQLRERYFAIKDLTDKTKLGEWSVDEDKLLLRLVDEYGESKWAKIAEKFPGRNRTQIRHRYTSVLKRWIAIPSFELESLKRHKRTTHVKSVKRVKQIDTSETKVRLIVEKKLKTGKARLKREKRAGKKPVK